MQVAIDTRAERARTLLAGARRASLRTASGLAEVALDGGLVLTLAHDAPGVVGLAQCRVATLVVPGEWSLRVVASFRMGHPDVTGRRAYAPTLLSVRLTEWTGRSVTVPVEEFLRAEPDAAVVRRRSRGDHLVTAHADELFDRARVAVTADELVLVGDDVAALTPDGVVLVAAGDLCSCE